MYYYTSYKQKETTVIRKILFKKMLDREQWVTPTEAKKYIASSESVIRKKFAELIESGHGKGVICTQTYRGGRKAYFIDTNKMKEFAELTGLILRQGAEKTDEWLDANDVFKFAYGKRSKLITYIYKYKQIQPDVVQYRLLNGKKVICLHIDSKDDFIKTYDLQPRTGKEWLSMYDLDTLFVEQYKYIIKAARDLAPLYPQDIQYQKRHSNTALCVKSTFVDAFAQIANLTPHEAPITEIKTKDWLNADEISKLTNRNHSKILLKMRELKEQNNPLVSVRFNKRRWPLCVHKKNLQKFLTQTGILTLDQIKTNQKLISFYQRQK